MQTSCKKLDKTCNLLQRLLRTIEVFGVPPIPYIGLGSKRFFNPPAPHLEICLMHQGGCPDLQVGDQPHPLRRGDVSLHNVHHGNYSGQHPDMLGWCLFLDLQQLTTLADLGEAPLALAFPLTGTTTAEAAFRHLSDLCYEAGSGPVGYFDPRPLYQQAYTDDRPGLAWRIKAALLDLLATLLWSIDAPKDASASLPQPVQVALRELRLHYQDAALGLPDIARLAGLSPNHLGRLFRETMGQSPMQYLQSLRLNQASTLLRHTDLRVGEVANQSGWRDPLYFSRLFKRETGHSPREYRTQHIGTTQSK